MLFFLFLAFLPYTLGKTPTNIGPPLDFTPKGKVGAYMVYAYSLASYLQIKTKLRKIGWK